MSGALTSLNPAVQLVAVKVFRFEKLLSSNAYQAYSKECNLLQKARPGPGVGGTCEALGPP